MTARALTLTEGEVSSDNFFTSLQQFLEIMQRTILVSCTEKDISHRGVAWEEDTVNSIGVWLILISSPLAGSDLVTVFCAQGSGKL